jgi:hypothetical protein
MLTWLMCALNWTQDHAGAVQALSAVVVAILTGFLVWFTRRYVQKTEQALEVSRNQLQVLREQVEDQKRAIEFSRQQHERELLENHRQEVIARVLEPLQQALKSRYGKPVFKSNWSGQRYNPTASAQENPAVFGPVLTMSRPEGDEYDSLDQALLEDARQNHYRLLMNEWERFKTSWQADRDQQESWIQEMARHILSGSGLPAHPSNLTGNYVMDLTLGLFIYDRLIRDGMIVLRISDGKASGIGFPVLTDGGTNYAAGPDEQMQKLMGVIEALLESQRKRATEFREQSSKLEDERTELSRKFSYAIADKTLPEKCPLVSLR